VSRHALPVDRLVRDVRAVLAAGGGLNRRTRAQVVALCAAEGADPVRVLRLVAGAEAAAGDARAPGAFPPAGGVHAGAAAQPPHVGPTQGGVRSPGLAVGIAAFVGGAAISLALVTFALSRSRTVAPVPGREPAQAPHRAAAAQAGSADAPVRGAAADRAHAGAQSIPAPRAASGTAPPVPAMYASPPGFGADGASPWARAALESFSGDEAELLAMRRRLAAGAVAEAADRATLARAADALRGAWPLLDASRRSAAVEAVVAVQRAVTPAAELPAAIRALGAEQDRRDAQPASLWRGAAGAGLAAAASAPASGAADAFGGAAAQWLSSRVAAVADAVLAGDPPVAADAVNAWLRAVLAAGTGRDAAAADGQLLALLGELLRRAAPMDRPGVSADAAGSLLAALAWSGGRAERDRVAGAFRGWCLDPAVGSPALHGLTSVLAALRPGPWWDPWIVVPARADPGAREAAADRLAAALASAGASAVRPARTRLRGVPEETLARVVAAGRSVLARGGRSPSTVDRIVRVAELLAAVESIRALERGQLSDAEARAAQLSAPDGLSLTPSARWKQGAEPPEVAVPLTDGTVAGRLRPGADAEAVLEAVRELRRDGHGDRGPVDAAAIAAAALSAGSPTVRAQVRGAVLESLADGPVVAAALAAEGIRAADAPGLVELAEGLAGSRIEGATETQRRDRAVVALLDHAAALLPSERHRVDAAARSVSLSASSVARALGGTGAAPDAPPEAALRAWLDADLAASEPMLPPRVTASIAAAAAARRRLAAAGPQAAVAELASILDLAAAVEAERDPSRRAAAEGAVQAAAAGRRGSSDAVAQLDATARALLALSLDSLGGEVRP
jgi:hypothetical protein